MSPTLDDIFGTLAWLSCVFGGPHIPDSTLEFGNKLMVIFSSDLDKFTSKSDEVFAWLGFDAPKPALLP